MARSCLTKMLRYYNIYFQIGIVSHQILTMLGALH
jgi:hypothetical protein